MPRWKPDPTFYPTPALAAEAPAEELAYVALLGLEGSGKRDALGVVDTNPASKSYGRLVGQVDLPDSGNELHHFGWNACSSHLCPWAPNAHVERRYLVVPGIHSSRIHIIDTQPDPRRPQLVRAISAETVKAATGYSALHTVHCGPDGIYLNGLGSGDGDGPGGIFMLDHDTFEVKEQWEKDRGSQHLSYDFAWHLGHDTMITSEWGTPNMVKDGLNPELLLAGKYGHALHVWDLRTRRHQETLDLGAEQQMVLELRPAHDPAKTYGFALDDKFLYVSCWGTGEIRQYDVTDPFNPVLVGSQHIGGIVRRTPHPAAPNKPLNGAPQMVEISRDGRRVYLTNSLYSPWDAQFYPDGIAGWMVKLDVDPKGGMAFDPRFLMELEPGMRPHQVRLQGGDASSDSFCYPS
jgi:selenium-binding protein 1